MTGQLKLSPKGYERGKALILKRVWENAVRSFFILLQWRKNYVLWTCTVQLGSRKGKKHFRLSLFQCQSLYVTCGPSSSPVFLPAAKPTGHRTVRVVVGGLFRGHGLTGRQDQRSRSTWSRTFGLSLTTSSPTHFLRGCIHLSLFRFLFGWDPSVETRNSLQGGISHLRTEGISFDKDPLIPFFHFVNSNILTMPKVIEQSLI